MGKSYVRWLVIYDDETTQPITAQTVRDVLDSEDLEQNSDDVVAVIRI